MPTCFVVMGFGEKTDYRTGRVLNLDASYKSMIKPAVEEAGLECKRADEIIHAGIIDVPMYEQLLNADVVVADLSTYNPNAFYELGVRHALRPYTTITIAEDKMVYPFDVNHIAVRHYRHLGEDIGFAEAMRMKNELKQAIQTILAQPKNDSPVYEFLKGLQRPTLAIAEGVAAGAAAMKPGVAETKGGAPDQTISALMDMVNDAMASSEFATAKALLKKVHAIMPADPYVVQKLALATYKSKLPTPLKALEEAREILSELKPDVSTDTETLGIWGAIHKRIWDEVEDPNELDMAIVGYEKGFYLKRDYYNGINLAYLLDLRATLPRDRPEESIADAVLAQRTRRQVIKICEDRLAGDPAPPQSEVYWIYATLQEAAFGLRDTAAASAYEAQAASLTPAPAQWMKDTTTDQLKRLGGLLQKSPLKT